MGRDTGAGQTCVVQAAPDGTAGLAEVAALSVKPGAAKYWSLPQHGGGVYEDLARGHK